MKKWGLVYLIDAKIAMSAFKNLVRARTALDSQGWWLERHRPRRKRREKMQKHVQNAQKKRHFAHPHAIPLFTTYPR